LINFTREHEVRTIYAYGDEVLLHQTGRSAGCRVMTYDVDDGRMILKEDAWVKQGDNVLRGDVIRIWRDSERITSDSNVTFRIYMPEGEEDKSILPADH
jgi:lipopolysaccharide export system protein LptA